MTIAELLRKVQSVNIEEEVPKIIERQSADIILLNQLQLFRDGEDSLGNKNAPYKSASYAKKKEARNPQPGYGTPDLKDTGEFYQDFFVEAKGASFTISSTNYKTADLVAQYGKFIFGLSSKSRSEYLRDNFRPAVQNYITQKTGLVFK